MPNLPTSIHNYVTNVQLFAQFCIDTCKNELSLVQNVQNSFRNCCCTDMYTFVHLKRLTAVLLYCPACVHGLLTELIP